MFLEPNPSHGGCTPSPPELPLSSPTLLIAEIITKHELVFFFVKTKAGPETGRAVIILLGRAGLEP